MKEAFPLSWPDGWVRTRAEHRRPNNVWKKTFGFYRDQLIGEVERLKATSLVLSTNIPLTIRGLPREGYNPPDPSAEIGAANAGPIPSPFVLRFGVVKCIFAEECL